METGESGWSVPGAFEEYRLVQPLGRGAMGEVYLYRDTMIDRLVAIKFLARIDPSDARCQRRLMEGKVTGRLYHPNVVAIHRVGTVRGRPYLVYEYVRGNSLDRLELPRPWAEVLGIAVGLARGLTAAHRAGILHRDLKPANAIRSEAGEVKLLDFGLAELRDAPQVKGEPAPGRAGDDVKTTRPEATLTQSDDAGIPASAGATSEPGSRPRRVAGTPLYLAPERWRGEPATPQSDVYALGVMLYQLCTGRAPHQQVAIQELARAAEVEAPPLAGQVPEVDERFAAAIDRCLRPDPAQRFASGDELREALERLAPSGGSAGAAPPDKPYPGLHAFEREHRWVFFGRDAEARGVIDRLRAERLVVVTGDSGVGKSSLCRAGVLPLIDEGALVEVGGFRCVTLSPGRHPVVSLAAALATGCGEDPVALQRILVDQPLMVGRLIRREHGSRKHVLIFVDQLEELLTLAEPVEARAVAAAIEAWAAAADAIRVLATVRSDFFTRLAVLPGFDAQLTRAIHVLPPLLHAGLREAIEGPARDCGYRFESQSLVDELAASAGEVAGGGGLPLLQFALAELWEARDPLSRTLSVAALASMGGVEGALARHADSVIARFTTPRRAAARHILTRLVTAEGTRARRTWRELWPERSGAASPDDEAQAALEALVQGRLVAAAAEADAGDVGTYELAHEALIARWGTLREWLSGDAGARAARQRLERAAAEWDRLGRAREALFTERQLDEASSVARLTLSARETAFLDSSRRARRNRRWLRIAAALALPLTALIVWRAVALQAQRALDRQIEALLSKADAALVVASEQDTVLAGRRQQAWSQFDTGKTAGGERTWSEVLTLAGVIDQTRAEASRLIEEALMRDGSRGDVRRRLADVLYQRALQSERDRRPAQRDELLERLKTYDESGEYLRRWTAKAQLSVETTPTGAALSLERYVPDDVGRLQRSSIGQPGTAPFQFDGLDPGSYLLTVSLPGRPPLRHAMMLHRNERTQANLAIPATVPAGYVYIPPGGFLFGSDGDEDLRRNLLTTEPLHEVRTGPYLIARNEVTFADWMQYLRALPVTERERHRLGLDNRFGVLDLTRLSTGAYRLTLKPRSTEYEAVEGKPIRYRGRNPGRDQDWRRFPVSAVSWDAAAAYLKWLHDSGRLRGARLCTEHEWERAARGADARRYPHGDQLAPADANHDATYDRQPAAYGPDEVGSHPASDSPFGIADLAGNVWEWTAPAPEHAAAVIYRGGSYYQDPLSQRSDNRQAGESAQTDALIGLRVCASVGP